MAGAERRRATDAADGRQADIPRLLQVRIEPKMIASTQAGPRGRHVQPELRHGCSERLEALGAAHPETGCPTAPAALLLRIRGDHGEQAATERGKSRAWRVVSSTK